MKKVFFILGNSGVGKDTAADYLQAKYGLPKLHPISDWKRFLEDHFGLNDGDLDDPEIKNQLIPGSKITYNQYMIDHYHYCQEKQIPFSLPYVKKISEFYLGVGSGLVSVALRNLHEIEEILDKAQKYNAITTLIIIERKGGDGLSSDDKLEETKDYLFARCDQKFKIINNGSLDTFCSLVGSIYHEVVSVKNNA